MIGRGWFVLFTAFSYSLISDLPPIPVFSQVRGGGANFYHSTTYTVAFPVFWAASFLIWFISLWFYLLSIRNLSKSHFFWCLFLTLLALSWIYPLSFWKANVVICQIQKLTAFTRRSRPREGCMLLPVLLNIVLEVLAAAIRQGKNNRHPNCKGRQFADDIISYIANPKDVTKNY